MNYVKKSGNCRTQLIIVSMLCFHDFPNANLMSKILPQNVLLCILHTTIAKENLVGKMCGLVQVNLICNFED
jgi:hypothetical protein